MRNWHGNDDFLCCANNLEDIDHLFMHCPFLNDTCYTIAEHCPIPTHVDLHFLSWIELSKNMKAYITSYIIGL